MNVKEMFTWIPFTVRTQHHTQQMGINLTILLLQNAITNVKFKMWHFLFVRAETICYISKRVQFQVV